MSNAWRSGSTTRWRKIRAYVLERDRHLCRIGTPGVCVEVATHVDHIIPKENGGDDHETNLRAACEPCNLGRKRSKKAYHEPDPIRVSNW